MNLIRTDLGVAVERDRGEPLPIRHIIGIGRNYAEHAREQGLAPPDSIVVFTKNPAAACLSGDDIIVPAICQNHEQVDFEGELGVVIGHPARDVPEGDALAHVLGYCCANDVSARWWQKSGSGGQYCRGKSFDTFCPIGPALVPAGEVGGAEGVVGGAAGVGDPQDLRLVTRVSGEVMQDARTSQMLFPVAVLIAELSRGCTLLPGTLILTGTPAGVGMSRNPPRYLRDGDTVEVEIDKLGTLRNPVRFEK